MDDKMTDVLGINYSGKDWFHVKQILIRSIDDAVSRLCGEIDERETNKLRGIIFGAKSMLALEQVARDTLARMEKDRR